MSAKDDMMKRINKKAATLRRLKRRHITSKSYIIDIIDFLNEIGTLLKNATDQFTYYNDVVLACKRLDEKLKTFDPYISAEVRWHDYWMVDEFDDNSNEWQNFYAEGVMLTWSPEYLLTHPNTEMTEYVDHSMILLDDL